MPRYNSLPLVGKEAGARAKAGWGFSNLQLSIRSLNRATSSSYTFQTWNDRSMTKMNPEQERSLITRRDPKRPYGAKVAFQILHAGKIGGLTHVTVLLDSGAIATIQPARSNSWEAGVQFQVSLEGFPTATLAETEGFRLAQALLLVAASLDFGLRLVYHVRQPCLVYERYREEGDSIWVEAVTGWPASIILGELTQAFRAATLDEKLELSMELFCAANLEMNPRARFITVVSALEPLAQSQKLGANVAAFVEKALDEFDKVGGIEEHVRNSLRGRIRDLHEESVRQALRRILRTWFPNRADILKQVDFAYELRSQLIHDGKLKNSDIDLATETNKVARLLRSIYEREAGYPFRVPAAIDT